MRGSGYRPSKADEQPLVLRTNIAAIGSPQPESETIPLELLDTPGPNEAGEEHLRYSHLQLTSLQTRTAADRRARAGC